MPPPPTQPELSLTRAEVRDVDRRAIEQYHIPGIVLMENAGRGAAELLLRLGCHGKVVICAGKGNNGGDGFVIARHLAISSSEKQIHAEVLLFCDPAELTGDAATNYRILEASGGRITLLGQSPDSETLHRRLNSADWIVDALLGTGTQGEIRDPCRTVIPAINAASKPILAIDLPSGLDCDTGLPLGPCVRASHTATFVARKAGFDNPAAQEWTGIIHVLEIGAPHRIIQEILADRTANQQT